MTCRRLFDFFSTEGTSIRWIEMKEGMGGDPLWAKGESDKLGNRSRAGLLWNGDPSGTIFQSVRQMFPSGQVGFTYEDQDPKSLEELVEIHFHSVGRETPLLLNIPPNQDGLFDMEKDIERLYELRPYRNELIKKIWLWELQVSGPALSADSCHHRQMAWKAALGKRCRLLHPVRTRLRDFLKLLMSLS